MKSGRISKELSIHKPGFKCGIVSTKPRSKRQLKWERGNWAIDCDIPGNDSIVEESNITSDCLNSCLSSINCTHFVWVNKTCHKKSGQVTKEAAILRRGALCGIVIPLGINFIRLIKLL